MLAALLLAANVTASELPRWSEGTLEIHQISTGRGNAAFLILPDGTTMLVDAGAAGDGTVIRDTEPRPNASRTAGAWIARYIERAVDGKPHIDYAVITHFHADHMAGLSDVGDRIPIARVIDRGFDFVPPPGDDALMRKYRAFVDGGKTARETIRVGRNDQIFLRNARERYPSFEVRNVAANGDVWTGSGDGVRHVFPPLDAIAKEDRPSENMCSIGLRIRYGKFDYFTGGDMPGVPDAGAPEWQSVETPVAKAIGVTDVHVVNHHGSIDPESAFFLSTLQSTVMILPAWSPTHPSQDALKRMLATRLYTGPHDLFVTTLREPTKASIGSRVSQLKAEHGHIVIRVAPGGDTYTVYVLDDESEEARVLSQSGPYSSK